PAERGGTAAIVIDVAGEGARFVALVVPAMTFAVQQAPMHRAMDEVFGESAHHEGGNRDADKSDHVEHAIVPWLKWWAHRYSTTGPSWRTACRVRCAIAPPASLACLPADPFNVRCAAAPRNAARCSIRPWPIRAGASSSLSTAPCSGSISGRRSPPSARGRT